MNESAITVRYAKALFSLAKERNILLDLKADMELFSDIYKNSDDFLMLIKSPVIKSSEKIRLIDTIFQDKINELTLNFFRLVFQNKREIFIPEISNNILKLIREEKGIKTAVLTTASSVDNNTLDKITRLLENELGGKVELTNCIKPQIIGGIIIRVNDKQYDASIAKQLNKVKQKLLTTQL